MQSLADLNELVPGKQEVTRRPLWAPRHPCRRREVSQALGW